MPLDDRTSTDLIQNDDDNDTKKKNAKQSEEDSEANIDSNYSNSD